MAKSSIHDILKKWHERVFSDPEENTERAVVDTLNLDDSDQENYYTAKVRLTDDPEAPRVYDRIPIETDCIPRPGQSVRLTKEDPGGEIPFVISSLVDDEKFIPPIAADYAADIVFEPGDRILRTDTGLIIMKVSGEIHIITNDGDSADPRRIDLFPDGDIVIKNGKGIVTVKNDGEISLKNDKANVTLKNDGQIKLFNDTGLIEMEPGGTVKINNALEITC